MEVACACKREWVCVWERVSERRKTCESISFTAVLPHNVRILHGNTAKQGKNFGSWSVPARMSAHEGEVVGGPVHSRGYFAVFVGWLSVYCMRSFTLSTLSLSLSLISLFFPLTISLPPTIIDLLLLLLWFWK